MTDSRAPSAEPRVRVLGAPRPPLRDFYHALLRLSWTRTLLLVAGSYLALNLLFACFYSLAGGVAHAHEGFIDYFYFSVQTMGTIGYGAMFPETHPANLLVVL
ncbi:MAG TPA: potassium channel family protein, partial [Polyangiaceae bacterium]|nr:potassium channel family protein [Polyangiaceae bacterium]